MHDPRPDPGTARPAGRGAVRESDSTAPLLASGSRGFPAGLQRFSGFGAGVPKGRDLESVEHTGLAGRAPLALGLLGLVAWGTIVGGTFQDDDLVGPLGLAGAWRIRPFLRLTFSLQEALHGHRADLLLAGNLALLVVTALGVHALALRRLGRTGAFLAGAAFLLQPAHAEAVAYVSGRSTPRARP